MSKLILMSFLLLISSFKIAYSQEKFVLNIVGIRNDISSVKLSFVLDSIYYKNNLNILKELNLQLETSISGEIENPYLCELIINEDNYSLPFLIYPRQNNLRIVKISDNFVVLNDNKKEEFFEFYYLKSLYPNSYDIYQYLSKEKKDQFENEKDSLLLNSYIQTDSILYNYTKIYPKSYYGLWFIARLIRYGYNNIHGKPFSNLSAELRNSFIGKLVESQIESYEKVSLGKIISNISFQDSNYNNISLLNAVKQRQTTLLSFWYHNCSPCIRKFPDLISLHKDYSENFQVIGISTDAIENRDKWRGKLIENKLPWTNLIDLKQESFESFKIHVFPFSYLVNTNGEIIKVNPSIVELKKYLDKTP